MFDSEQNYAAASRGSSLCHLLYTVTFRKLGADFKNKQEHWIHRHSLHRHIFESQTNKELFSMYKK